MRKETIFCDFCEEQILFPASRHRSMSVVVSIEGRQPPIDTHGDSCERCRAVIVTAVEEALRKCKEPKP